MKADLHVHTDISDGSLSIGGVLELARKASLTHLAITNHDTVEGLQQARLLGERLQIRIIPGVEISAIDQALGRKVHILGYHFQTGAPHITRLCDPLLKWRQRKSLWQLQQLTAHGYRLDLPALYTGRAGKVLYKQHIMEQLMAQGYTDAVYSPLYEQLFRGSGICASEIEYIDVFAAVEAIKADGGIAVLAHPGYQDTYYLVEQLAAAGLDGIELNHEMHTKEDHRRIKQLAQVHKLLLTGGSDFHGTYGTTELGGLLCPPETMEYFEARSAGSSKVLSK